VTASDFPRIVLCKADGTLYDLTGTALAAVPTFASFRSGASTNSTLVAAGARTIWDMSILNTTATQKFVKLYDKATAPVVGTDGVFENFGVAANSTLPILSIVGRRFLLGIGFGITGAAPWADTTATAVGDVFLHVNYS
jgi:hypothetical protein